MASEQLNCPECEGPIGADWDWCMHCGYDPDHLKPWDWQPGSGGGVRTATAGGGVGLIDLRERKRRSKRAARPKRKSRSRQADREEPKLETMATTSSLISLPPRPGTPTARQAPLQPAAPDQVAPPAPTIQPAAPPPTPAATASSVAALAETMRSRPIEPPATIDRPTPRSEAPTFDMTSPVHNHTYAPTTPKVATRTIALPRTTLSLVPVFVLFALAALMLFVAFSSMAKLAEGSVLSRATTVLFVLVCLALACGMAAQGYTFLNVRVEVGPDEIVAHNRFGRPSTARVRDIFSVTMGSRRYLDVPLVGRPVEVPYVQMQDGSGFWLDALEGHAGEPPSVEQLAVVDALARTVAANRDEARHDEAGTDLV